MFTKVRANVAARLATPAAIYALTAASAMAHFGNLVACIVPVLALWPPSLPASLYLVALVLFYAATAGTTMVTNWELYKLLRRGRSAFSFLGAALFLCASDLVFLLVWLWMVEALGAPAWLILLFGLPMAAAMAIYLITSLAVHRALDYPEPEVIEAVAPADVDVLAMEDDSW